MISLAGYQINNEIHKSNRTIVFRGTRLSDNCPVVIKYLSKEYPTSKELSDFTYEYKIMNKLSGEGIIKPYDIVKYGNSLAIIMEDIGGESIADAMKSTKLSITEKMLLSIQMTDSLLQVHKQNIIHKDVNPSNFIWNRKTNQVKIIDFGISTELASEDFQYTNTMNPDGTLEYMSPEQTGRINKPVDYRTDFYSLGITLYELFSGKLPFAGEDESEMVYYHIAKTPAPLYLVSPEIPKCLSDIVMKLISKSAEERYQSASGIKKDLEHCYQSLKSGTEISNFVPGKDDIIERFEIPYKLFGREEEIEILVKKFEDASKGNCELVLVGGYPGIGKSSLINEIRKPITFRKGRFIYGKCEQRKCNTPYYGLRQAFQELVRQLLTEPQSSLDTWKQRLMDALGENGQLITDIIPDLEQIIGLQPHATELNPVESQNRIQMVFLEFIKVFAQKEHPLIIFLDDLQWCDAATINLIYYIFSMDTLQYALFVCAYRDNELQAGYRISQLFEKLRELNSCTELFLKPLDFTAVNDLVSETLHSPPDATKPLTELIIKKTNGNPFFTIKMLKSLYLQKAFTFIPEKGQWSFDLEKVRNAEISDNLIDLIIKGLESLSERTVNTLKLAACIGNQFDFRTLLLVKNDPESLLNKDLWTAINKEIIIPLDNNYRLIGSLSAEMYKDVPIRFSFTHERVRQAVYSLITDNDRAKMHLSIGYIYLKLFQKEKRTDLLYDLVNHLNIGRELIQNIKELIELSDLNIMAGSKAKKSTAFAAAENYFAIAQSLLSDELWAKTPRKYFKLLIDRANVALLSGNLTLSENLCIRLLDKAQSNIDKASISIIRVQIFEYQGKHKEAIDEVRRSLRLFDIHLPDNDQEIVQKIHEGIFKLKSYLKRITIDGLKNLPEMKDPEKIIIMQMVFQMVPAAYQSNPQLFVLISLMMFELTCEYGVSPLSCKCFTDCAIILGSLGEYETGYKLAEAAFSLLNRLKAEAFRASVCYGFTFTSYTRAHYSESLNYYDMAYHKGLETGDIHHASFALADKLLLLLYTGKNLNECMQETEDAVTYLNKINISLPQLLAQMIHYMIRKFQSVHDKKEEKNFLRKDEEIITTLKSTNNLGFLCRFYILNAYMNIIFGKMDDAEKWNNMAQEVIRSTGLVQDYSVPDHYMFQGLILCNKWSDLSENEKIAARETLTNIQQQLKRWMENCPDNFAHKYYLLTAEMAIIDDAPIDTVDVLFRKALESIGSNDFIQFRALCNELYGKFWLAKGNNTIAALYTREAHYLYQQWGATGKVAQLVKQYPDYLKVSQEYRGLTGISSYTTQSSIDMVSIIKATQAISSEIKIDKLLTTFTKTIIENAGAQKGFLLLKNEHDNKLYIEAKKTEDNDQPQVMQSIPYTQSSELCPEIIQYVARTKKTIVANNACSEGSWRENPYIAENKVKSVLCMPVIYQTRFVGIVYLENNLSDNVFTLERLEILKILSTQAAISIENAMLYENMEERIRERTAQLDKANEKLRELSYHDPLTGLYNRRYTFQFISKRVESFIKNKRRLLDNNERRDFSAADNVIGIFLIDIDHFKDVNDTYGHAAGDATLVLISNLIKQMIRSDDYLVRWGGEEFLIILFDTKREYLDVFSKEVLVKVRETPFKVSDSITIHKTCSLGCVDMPVDSANPDLLNMEQMINLSDYALYYAKKHGRNCGAHFKLKENVKLDEYIIKDLMDIRTSKKVIEEYFNIDIMI